MKRRPSKVAEQVAAMRRSAHEALVSDLRDGRRQRATTVPSGKRYRRRPKHRQEAT